MTVVASSKVWPKCAATGSGKATKEECESITRVPQRNAAYCTISDCQSPWRYRKTADQGKQAPPSKMLVNGMDPEQIAEWNRRMKAARKAVDTMELVRLDPKTCIPYQGKTGQPRKDVDVGLDELTESIRVAGQWTPGVVRQTKKKLNEILSGERRWRSVSRIEDRLYLAIRVQVDDDDDIPFILACIANGNTTPLKPLEMCSAIEELYDHQELPMPYIAKAIFGISIQKAYAYHRLIHLVSEVRDLLASGKITESDAFRLSGLTWREQVEEGKRLQGGKLLRQLGDPVPRTERGIKSKRVTKPNEPVERLTEFATRLRISTVRLEKVLGEMDLSVIFKGKTKKHAAVYDAIFEAHEALAKCKKALKAAALK